MKAAAIIAEYNPFHNGHKYQLEEIRKDNEAVIVIMSSSFTQRGIPAILDKFTRAQTAVQYGADIVIELPVIFSSSNAEIFAKGAVGILNNIDFINRLYFGTEDSLEDILSIHSKIKKKSEYTEESIKKYLSEGFSYLTAKEKSLDFLSSEELNILKKPNNILAFEYIKALEHFNSHITPVSILRHKANHNSTVGKDIYASGSSIRNMAFNNEFDLCRIYTPSLTCDALENNKLNFFGNYFSLFKYRILMENIDYSDYFDFEKGLDDRFRKFLNTEDINEYISSISTKRYTKSRISRLMNNIILDIKKDFIKSSLGIPYLRVLALSEKGGKLIKNDSRFIKKFSKIFTDYDEEIVKIAEKEIFATNLYNMFTEGTFNEDFLRSPFYKKELRD